MSRSNLAWLLGIAAVGIMGIAITQSAPLRAKDKDYDLVRLFVDVLDEVERKYVRELDDDLGLLGCAGPVGQVVERRNIRRPAEKIASA